MTWQRVPGSNTGPSRTGVLIPYEPVPPRSGSTLAHSCRSRRLAVARACPTGPNERLGEPRLDIEAFIEKLSRARGATERNVCGKARSVNHAGHMLDG